MYKNPGLSITRLPPPPPPPLPPSLSRKETRPEMIPKEGGSQPGRQAGSSLNERARERERAKECMGTSSRGRPRFARPAFHSAAGPPATASAAESSSEALSLSTYVFLMYSLDERARYPSAGVQQRLTHREERERASFSSDFHALPSRNSRACSYTERAACSW